jgi:hypothetical protein
MKISSNSEKISLAKEKDTDLLFLESSIITYLKKDKKTGIDIMNWINTLNFWKEKIDENIFAQILKNLTGGGLISPIGDKSDVLSSTYSTTDKGLNMLENDISLLKRRNNALLTILKVYAYYGLTDIKSELQYKRDQWREIRKKKLQRKEELMNMGFDMKKIKKDDIYKKLIKEQQQLSQQMKQIEKRFHRTLAKTNINGNK